MTYRPIIKGTPQIFLYFSQAQRAGVFLFPLFFLLISLPRSGKGKETIAVARKKDNRSGKKRNSRSSKAVFRVFL